MKGMKRYRRTGQAFIELAVGSVVFLLVAFLFLDLTTVVLAVMANDQIAKTSARAAANHDTEDEARESALKVVGRFSKSSLVESVALAETNGFSYQYPQRVKVRTILTLRLPAPLAVLPEKITVRAEAHEPILVPVSAYAQEGDGVPTALN